MRKKLFALILIIMITTLIVKPLFAADEYKATKNQTITNFVQTYDNNPYDLNGTLSHWNKSSSSYSLRPYRRSQKIDFTLVLPVPLVIDSSDKGEFDPTVELGLVPKWKEKNISGAIGIKYSFSRFEFQHFAKSLVSFFSNMNKNAAGRGSKRNLPVSFYLSLPEF